MAFDEAYATFLKLGSQHIASAISNAVAYDEERCRAEALAEIDRAKTVFFSNISHELRTPLTLIMGPTDDALSAPEPALKGEALKLVHRNELRLLKLVNSLLDFARMEAGRAEASFQCTDVGQFTREVASAFSSAIERAGLEFVVDCGSLEEPTYVDRASWEKVVLNLLSNALKFTFEGRITLRLRASGEHAELQVSDTGVGIPAAELPHVFERFRRVPGSRSRTHEGSGIGLALVCEIAKMHGGTVEVQSMVDQGTTFTVRIPLGKAHLDPTRVESKSTQASTALGAAPFIAEALRWLPGAAIETATDGPAAPALAVPAEIANARIIVADDNADMREYLTRLLSQNWRVEAVADGGAALAAAHRERPDLVLTDVMMPVLDGFGLLRELRADASLASTPVLLLSARAGEEASVEGLVAGADDYLVKPFASRELLARVSTHLQLHRSREHLELALEGAALAAWDWNVQTGEFIHNARWAELRGYDPEEVPQRVESFFGGIHPDDVPRMQQLLKDHFEGHRSEYSVELRVATKDGRWVWVLQRGKVFARDEDGRPLRMAGTSLDISSQKRNELEQRFLAEVGTRLQGSLVFEDTLSALADLVVAHLADYCVIDMVEDTGEIRRAKVACSLEKKRELAEAFARLPLGSPRTPILLQVLKGGTNLLFETVTSADLEEWARNDEHLRLLRESEVRSLLWVPLIGRDRILGGFCLASTTLARQYGRDDLRLAEELAYCASLSLENARLYGAAERAIAARDQVLAVVAHDLRNPLGAIVMQASALQSRVAEPESPARKASERIKRAAERMGRLIEDLLDVTRVEAGQLALERAELRTRDVAVEALEAQKALAAASSIELRLDAPEHPPDIFADRHRLLQVLENLIGNAMRFTPAVGRITVGIVPRAESVLCYVRDTGRGISSEELPHLFDRFWQARRSREEKRSGAGLGLAIVKGATAAAFGSRAHLGKGARSTSRSQRLRPRTSQPAKHALGRESQARHALLQDVAVRRDEHAGTAGFAPYALVARTHLAAVVVAGMELSIVDPELAIEEMQLLDPAVDVRRIFHAGLEPHQHRDPIGIAVLREELVPEPGRRFLPFRFFPVVLERGRRYFARLLCDPAREALPERSGRAQYGSRPGDEGIDDRAERLDLPATLGAFREVRLHRRRLACRQRLKHVEHGAVRVLRAVPVRRSAHGFVSSASACRSLSSPERMRVFTVPSG